MSNPYYTHGSFPSTGAAATSASMRAELDLISAAFDKLPTLASNANKFVVVNSTGTGLTTTSTLPAASVNDSEFTIQDTADTTRKFQFVADSITPGATRLFTMPDADTTLVGTTTTQTLTNKTLTSPVIGTIVNTGTLTLPTSTDTLVGRATTDTLTNKTLTAPVIATISNTGTLTLPTSTDTLVGRATTDTLTNKTISGSNNTLSNIANSSLTNSSVTIGSSSLSLGGTLTTLAGVTISGASNTLSNIANASLTNSSITVNSTSIALGGSATITAANPNAITVSTGLQLNTGTTYDGSAARTISIDSTVATLSGSQTLSNKTISGSSNTLSNIANASLTNSSITIGSSSISLGSTASTISGLTSLSSTGLVMTANAASSTAISAIAQSAGTVTVTASGHGLTSGDLVSIDGVADYTYCGLVTVNVTNANVFTYSAVTTNSSSSGGYVTKLQGTWASYSGGTGPAYKGGPLVINASSQMPALRVTQGGNGYAFIVEDAANPDTSAFIISNAGDLAINVNKFTVAAATGNTVIGGSLTATALVKVGDSSFTLPAVLSATAPAKLYVSTATVTDGTSAGGAINTLGTISAFGSTTVAATNASVTYTNLATLYIAGAPTAGTNVTITNPYSLYIAAGAAYFGGAVTHGGNLTVTGNLTVNSNTTLGDAAGDTLTINGTAVSIPNSLAFATNLLYLNSAITRVGVGTASPAELFDVYNGRIQNSSSNNTAFDTYQIYASAFPTNEKYWRTQVFTGGTAGTSVLRSQFVNDAYSTASTWMTVTRNALALTEVAFNEDSNDADFRVESDGNTHGLFIDGGENTVNFMYSTGTRPTGATGVVLQIGQVNNGTQIYHKGSTANKGWLAGGVGDAYYIYEQTGSGAFTNRLQIGNGGEMVINEEAADRDFRIEAVGRSYALFVDASAATIGINNNAPVGDLDVIGTQGVYLSRAGSVNGRVLYLKQFNDYGYSFNVDSISTGKLFINAVNNGVESSLIEWDRTNIGQVNYGSATFNESGGDYDFRVESDNRPYMLFVDAGTDQITMGQATPRANATLTVGYWGGSAGNNAQITVDANTNSGTGQAALLLLAGSGSTNRASRLDFLNGVNSTTTPRWTLINDYDQNGTNDFRLINASTQNLMTFTQSGGVVFNEDSVDYDFRVESNNQTHAIFVDAGEDVVAFNTSNTLPWYQRAVQGPSWGITELLGVDQTAWSTGCYQDAYAYDTSWKFAGSYAATLYTQTGDHNFLVTSSTRGPGNAITWKKALNLSDSLAVFNEDSNDIDFRVESDGNTHCLFVDAGNSKVAINSATVQAGAALNVYNGGILNYQQFDLSGTTLVDIATTITGGLLVIRDNVNGGTCLVLTENGATPIIVSQSGGNYTIGTPTGSQIKLSAATTKVQASMASGQSTNIRVMVLICDPD